MKSSYQHKSKEWILDIIDCVNRIPNSEFTLVQMYKFTDELSLKHPENKHIKDKIRQQLQVLRDKGIIEFNGKGHYKKIG